MTRDELLATLRRIATGGNGDPENWHMEADAALLAFINDEEVTEAWQAIDKWFA